MDRDVVIESRFRGPPRSGNGGYVSGLLAEHVAGLPEITLRRPIPLDTPMRLGPDGGDGVRLLHGETLVAEGRPSDEAVPAPPPPPDWDAVLAAERGRDDKADSDFRRCFVCGCDRDEGDGLRVLAAPLEGGAAYSAPWTPHPRFAGADGLVAPIYLWSALDCPGALAVATDDTAGMLLGRIRVDLRAPVRAGMPHFVLAWPHGRDGRKLWAGTALFTADGRECARAFATWFVLAD